MIIYVNKGDTAYDHETDCTVEIIGTHFDEWSVRVHHDITDDDCNVIGEYTEDEIFSKRAIDCIFGNGNRVILRDDSDDADEDAD